MAPKRAGHRVTVQARHSFELSGSHALLKACLEVVPRSGDPGVVTVSSGSNPGSRIHLQQRIRNSGNDLIPLQLLERPGHIRERGQQRFVETLIATQHVAHEWQASRPPLQRIAHERGLQINHAIAETRLGAGAPVMHLIGMNHNDIAAHAVGAGTAIHEGLNAAERVSNGVEVVAMRVIRVTCEKCIEALEAGLRRRARDAVPLGLARSFNTAQTGHG